MLWLTREARNSALPDILVLTSILEKGRLAAGPCIWLQKDLSASHSPGSASSATVINMASTISAARPALGNLGVNRVLAPITSKSVTKEPMPRKRLIDEVEEPENASPARRMMLSPRDCADAYSTGKVSWKSMHDLGIFHWLSIWRMPLHLWCFSLHPQFPSRLRTLPSSLRLKKTNHPAQSHPP